MKKANLILLSLGAILSMFALSYVGLVEHWNLNYAGYCDQGVCGGAFGPDLTPYLFGAVGILLILLAIVSPYISRAKKSGMLC
ncbi:MAG: hypothetical protein JRN08_02805 [Nitrososphaerota archaeon]|nr:hypothetical protein [Nitrososphaerota archaeon]